VHGRNFLAGSAGVNRHGAILGMQMQCNTTFPVIPGLKDQTRNLEIPGSMLRIAPE
jgi:hypothetical protein